MELIIIITSNLIFFAFIGLFFYRILVTGKFTKGLFRIYLFQICYFFFMSVVAHGFVSAELAKNTLPDGICMPPVIFLGWIPSMIIAGIAMGFRPLYLKKKGILHAAAAMQFYDAVDQFKLHFPERDAAQKLAKKGKWKEASIREEMAWQYLVKCASRGIFSKKMVDGE